MVDFESYKTGIEDARKEAVVATLPNVSADVVEEAKEFAAAIVRPEEPVFPKELVEKAVVKESVEEVAVLDTVTLSKIVENPEIEAALAAEGLRIDKTEIARAIEESKQRADLEIALAPEASVKDLNQTFVERTESLTEPLTELDELKLSINSSFEEVASLLLEHQRQIDEIEARLTNHNARGGHKI